MMKQLVIISYLFSNYMSSKKHCFLPLNGVKLTASCQCNKIIVRKPKNVKMYMWFNSNIYINGEPELGLCFFPFFVLSCFLYFYVHFFQPHFVLCLGYDCNFLQFSRKKNSPRYYYNGSGAIGLHQFRFIVGCKRAIFHYRFVTIGQGTIGFTMTMISFTKLTSLLDWRHPGINLCNLSFVYIYTYRHSYHVNFKPIHFSSSFWEQCFEICLFEVSF